MIACFLSNISAKYYKNPSMLSRVIAKNVGDVFFWDTVYFKNIRITAVVLARIWLLDCAIAVDFLSDRLSDCPSVCQMRALWQNEIIVCKYIKTIR